MSPVTLTTSLSRVNLEPVAGIEPASYPYQGHVMPLYYTGVESGAGSRGRTGTSTLATWRAEPLYYARKTSPPPYFPPNYRPGHLASRRTNPAGFAPTFLPLRGSDLSVSLWSAENLNCR